MRSLLRHCIWALTFSMTVFQSSFSYSQERSYTVDVFYPETRSVARQVSLSGTVEAKQNAQLAPLQAGVVDSLSIEVGDEVEKGQVLLTLDKALAQLNVNSAQSAMLAAQVNVDETQRLYQEAVRLSESKVIPETLIAQRNADVQGAKARLAQAKAEYELQAEVVSRHELKAPFSGVIVSRQVDIGEWVSQQTPLLTLVEQSNLRLSVAIPQEYYPFLAKQQGLGVDVYPDLPNSKSVSASLSRIVPVSDSMSRSFTAQIDLPDNKQSNANLVAGMSASVKINIPQSSSNEVVLPRSAIKQHPDGGSSVFVVENNRAKRINTSFTNVGNSQVAIPDPQLNLPFVVTAVELLVDGAPVNVNQTRRN